MYIIGNNSFKAQYEIKNFIKELFTNNGYGKANPRTYSFLVELIKRHPDYEAKTGVGIDFFTISKNPYSRQKCFHLTFTRLDGSTDDISYNLCIKGKELTKKQQTLNAMRHSIRSDIKYFKMNAVQKCNSCDISEVDFDCDHYGVEFKEISENFIEKCGVCKSFATDECFTCFADDEYKNKWIDYHNDIAKLQLLCVSCHKNKSKKLKCKYIS